MAELGVCPEECVMIGNDVDEDMIATKLGIGGVFLLTNDIINKSGTDIEQFPHGDYDDLLKFIDELN